MREYKLSPRFFSQTQRTTLIFVIPIFLLAICGGFVIGGYAAPLMAIFLLLVYFLSSREYHHRWSSYRLLVSETSLKPIQGFYPDVTINFDEIMKVTEADGRGLNVLGLDIQTADPSRRIFVPKTLQDYSEFRLELAAKCTIERA